MTEDISAMIYGSLPDCVLIRDANYIDRLGLDPIGIVHLIGSELDRRRPEPVQYLDNDGREIKAEMIGYDDNGREIWLDM